MKEAFQKTTLFLILCSLVIVLGIPFGIYALTLNGGESLGGIYIIAWVVICGFTLLLDRIAVRYAKPVVVSFIELMLIVLISIYVMTL